jgi:hypothetical protein
MARTSKLGLTGTAYLRREDGSLTENSVSVFMHPIKIAHRIDSESIIINFGLWASKAEYKNENSEIDILGRLEKKYIIDEETKIWKDRDAHDADGVETTFAFTKANEGAEYLEVRIGNKLQILDVDYSISYDSGDSGTGSVIFVTAPESGKKIKLIKLKKAYDIYFKDAKTKLEGQNLTSQALEFLKNLDGTDAWDNIKIDWTGYSEDID